MSCCNDVTIYECSVHGNIINKMLIVGAQIYCEECVVEILTEFNLQPAQRLVQVCAKHEN